ncbi:MAG: YiaA/YiaB family inner membrane protein [Pseudomonadota bacterium]
MIESTGPDSRYYTFFSAFSFAVAALMMAIGIFNLEASFAAKGFYAMSAIMLVHSSITLSKTLRDADEAKKLHYRLEDAKTEKLLLDTSNADRI